MAKDDNQIAKNYVNGVPANESRKIFSAVRGSGSWTGNGPMYAPEGTLRFWYDDEGFLYSYKMALAHRRTFRGKPFILVNGDGAPSKMTSQHQGELRSVLRRTVWESGDRRTVVLAPHAYIPFSVLRGALLRVEYVEVIDVTEDREVKCKGMRKNRVTNESEEYEYTVHFLGETLFHCHGRYYVCGLDRNDNPNKRMFYMARIPGNENPGTVDAALMRLRPEGLPENAVRQGEWFFVPVPDYKPPKPAPEVVRAKRVSIVADDPKEQLRDMVKTRYVKRDGREVEGYVVPGRVGRHVASELVVNGAVYARGTVRDEEHTALRLGKTWHRVVKNLAVEGWRASPHGPKVD